MNAYNYDPATGEYLNAQPMRESPLEPGVFLLPANATEEEPPAAQPGHAVCWCGVGWRQVEDHRGQRMWTAGGQVLVLSELGPIPEGFLDEPPAPTLDEARAAKLAEIIAGADATLNALAADYSGGEKLSWPKQEAEALALLADPAAQAPLLRGMAAARGITVTTLRDKVLASVAQYEQVTALVLGTQQRYGDMLKAAVTVDEVRAIVVIYSVPGAG